MGSSGLVAALQHIPGVLETYALTGPNEILCWVVARSNDHLITLLPGVLTSPASGKP
ncbi:MAG: Lrp/AsnC family transcriptional regulator [Actinobacteria bacterium]|nr:Lrp/AsnC family transcriptional regulator [Actinomycetota bacterium]